MLHLIVLLLFICLSSSSCPPNSILLSPSAKIPHHQIAFQGLALGSIDSTHDYCLVGLQPLSTYEIRVSFPAIMPARFQITILDQSLKAPSRELLDTEKKIFETDGTGKVMGCSSVPAIVRVTAFRIGVGQDERISNRAVTYDVVLEPLFFGVVPRDATWLGAIGVMFVLGAFFLASRLTPQLVSRTFFATNGHYHT